MAMDKHYTLTYKGGLYTVPGNCLSIIGQATGCDVHVPNSSQYEDMVMAKIVPNRDAGGWHLVRLTTYYPIKVNGYDLNRVHYLNDGDVLEFPGRTFRFRIREGEQHVPSVTNIRGIGKMVWVIVAALIILAGVVGWQIYDIQHERITESMRSDIEMSLYTTTVDSLHLMRGDSIVDTYVYASSPVGTAFLTTDSLIVTARHCIQPWLNVFLPHEYSQIPHSVEWPVNKALFAETENQWTGSDLWRIESFLTFTDENGEAFALSSDDFKMNFDFDDIVELGDYYNAKFWRSISQRYSRVDMMLGDVAVAKAGKPGKIPLANKNEIEELLHNRGVKLTFVGHPESSVSGNRLDFKSDELRLPLQPLQNDSDRLFLISHEGGLTSGFSGGPVLVRDGTGFKAVGVISVVDDKNSNRSYSVPVSEVENIK